MQSSNVWDLVRRARGLMVVALLCGACAAEGADEGELEQSEQALRATTSAERAGEASAGSGDLTPEKAGVPLMQSYAVDERGAIETADGRKLVLAPSDLYQPDAQSRARLIATGPGGGGAGGGYGAWGCWTGSCCVSGHYTACPIGSCWVCDVRQPCERCIWPW